jgi:sensor histidine kinase regulating citrate/malate metabolism
MLQLRTVGLNAYLHERLLSLCPTLKTFMHTISNYCYEDYGCCMSKQSISKLFEPFYITKRGQGGSGLGLIEIQGLGGHITTSSEVGWGLKYNIEFPINGAECVSEVVM